MSRSRRAVVLGVDGSTPSRRAVRWAAGEARLRGAPLLLVHAWRSTWAQVPLAPPPRGVSPSEPKIAGKEILGAAAHEARAAAPDIEVSTDLVQGDPALVLLRHADDAEMIVLGDRGLGGFAGLMLGSVAVRVAGHVSCPVVIVRGDVQVRRPVLVGVDGSDASEAALAFGMEEADLRGVPLVAVHAWAYPAAVGVDLPWGFDGDSAEQHARAVLDETVDRWASKHPDVAVERHLAPMSAAAALVAESESAQLLVVGSHGRGALRRLLMGSVSHALMHHSRCPVVVLRPALDPRTGPMTEPPGEPSRGGGELP